jgi:hypothetical protein
MLGPIRRRFAWRRNAPPGPTRLKGPRVRLIAQSVVENSDQPLLNRRIDHRHYGLDPTVQVPLHHVGRPEPDSEGTAVLSSEPENPRVLQEPAHDRPHTDVLGQARHTWSKAASAPNHQVDGGTRSRCAVEGIDHLRVGQPVCFEDDTTGGARSCLGIDGGDHLAAGRDG